MRKTHRGAIAGASEPALARGLAVCFRSDAGGLLQPRELHSGHQSARGAPHKALRAALYAANTKNARKAPSQ